MLNQFNMDQTVQHQTVKEAFIMYVFIYYIAIVYSKYIWYAIFFIFYGQFFLRVSIVNFAGQMQRKK